MNDNELINLKRALKQLHQGDYQIQKQTLPNFKLESQGRLMKASN